jgi:hypothetical protein
VEILVCTQSLKENTVKKFELLTVVAALFAAPALARQSMNMTGMENTVGVLSSVTHPLLVRVGSDP